MGANFQSWNTKTTDKAIARRKFREYQDQQTYEYGRDSYNGTFSNCTLRGFDNVGPREYNVVHDEALELDKRDARAYRVGTQDEWSWIIFGWCPE
jgi:hypothetical protein